MVNNSRSLFTVKGLCVHDVLKLIHSFCGIIHVSSQVTVKETQRVAIERQADRDSTFVTLKDKQEEKRNKKKKIMLSCRINPVFLCYVRKESIIGQLRWKEKAKLKPFNQ